MKFPLLIISASACFFFSACSNNPEPNNFISNTKVTGQAVLYTEKYI